VHAAVECLLRLREQITLERGCWVAHPVSGSRSTSRAGRVGGGSPCCGALAATTICFQQHTLCTVRVLHQQGSGPRTAVQNACQAVCQCLHFSLAAGTRLACALS
jgi:hypothetical protein